MKLIARAFAVRLRRTTGLTSEYEREQFLTFRYPAPKAFGNSGFFILRVQNCEEGLRELSSSFSSIHTCMAISGHICAHSAHPVHRSIHFAFAGKYPLGLNSLSMTITPLGHASTQYLHPLQRSLSMMILPFMGAFPVMLTPQQFPCMGEGNLGHLSAEHACNLFHPLFP